MSHSEAAWLAEIEAHKPRTCDFTLLSEQVPDLSEWRTSLASADDLRPCLLEWEDHIQDHGLAVVVEQATLDGELGSEDERARRLQGCPARQRDALAAFVDHAPEPIRDYLAYACYCLVRIERTRRTGSPEWRSEAQSGSSEVLNELMFNWGPRFTRHRWTW